MAGNQKAQTNDAAADAAVSEEMVAKVGAAVGQVALIRQEYTERVQAATDDGERERLAGRAQQEAMKAIGDQGISVSDYNEVVTAAEGDPDLEDRLITAARAAS